MAQSATLPKISPPQVGRAVLRTRLFARLDSKAHGCQKIFVSGPPGAGKTTLVATHLAERGIRTLWYQIDVGDADPASFFHYMGLAAPLDNEQERLGLPRFAPESALGLEAFTRAYFRALFMQLGDRFALVLDNCHEAPPESPFLEIVRLACDELPPAGQLLLLSRAALPPQLARQQAYGALNIVDWNDLKLSTEEARQFALLHGRADLSHDALLRLNDEAGAWAAGFVLALRQSEPLLRSPASAARPGSNLFDFFAAEVFDRLNSTTQQILLDLSVLPRITPDAAVALTADAEAPKLLEWIAQNNLFTFRQGDRPLAYQFHPLFREFLLQRALLIRSPVEIAQLRRRAAGLLEGAGYIDDVAAVLREANAWDLLASFVCRHAPLVLSQSRQRTLATWLQMLPTAVIEADPWLLYWMGASQVLFDPQTSRPYFERAYPLFQSRGDCAGVLLAWSGVVDSIFHIYGDLSELDPWIAELEVILAKDPMFPSPEVAARVTFSMFVALSFRQPQHPQIGQWSERLSQIAAEVPDPVFALLARLHVATHSIWSGDLRRAAAELEELRDANAGGVSSPFVSLISDLVAATCYLHSGDHEDCLRAVESGLLLAAQSGIHIWDEVFLGHGASISLSRGDTERGRTFLQRMTGTLKANRFEEQAHFHNIACWSAWQEGKKAQARRHVHALMDYGARAGLPYFHTVGRLTAAIICLECGESAAAFDHLNAARTTGYAIGNPMIDWMADLTEAYMRFAQGDDAIGLACLSRGMASGVRHGYRHFFFWPRDAIAADCLKALEHSIEPEYAIELIRRSSLDPPASARFLDGWPWPLKVATLGRFEVMREGKLLRFGGKPQHMPLRLLKAVIAFGGHEVSEQQIIDVLWPDSEGDAGKQAFATTLARLRKLVGSDTLIRQDSRISLDPDTCWIDALALERHLDSPGSCTDKRLEHIGNLYRGPFLSAEDDAPWALPLREKLHVKVVAAMLKLGDQAHARGQQDKAIAAYQRGLEIDDLVEGFYAGLMNCHAALGQNADAVTTYRRCQRVFSARLGVEPSPATTRKYLSLLSSI